MANLVYQNEEGAITWQDSSGTNVIALQNLANGVGRHGVLHDFGTAARSRLYAWRFFCQFETTAMAVGETVEIYLYSSDGTHPDHDDLASANLTSTDKLRNLHFLGVLQVDEDATGVVMVKSGFVEIPWKEAAPTIFNNTAANLVNTANLNGFGLVPVPDEIQ